MGSIFYFKCVLVYPRGQIAKIQLNVNTLRYSCPAPIYIKYRLICSYLLWVHAPLVFIKISFGLRQRICCIFTDLTPTKNIFYSHVSWRKVLLLMVIFQETQLLNWNISIHCKYWHKSNFYRPFLRLKYNISCSSTRNKNLAATLLDSRSQVLIMHKNSILRVGPLLWKFKTRR